MFDKIIGSQRPLNWALQFWPVILLSFIVALTATWLCKKIALKFGIVDRPDDLVKTHKQPIAYLGGIAMLTGFAVGILAGIYCLRGQALLGLAMKWFLGILAGAAIACFVGVLDDIFDISPAKKIFGQIVAGFALVLAGIRPALHYFTEPLGWQMSQNTELILGIPFVIFLVLGAANSLNLLDGLDGLCAGVTAIITVAMLLLAIHLSTSGFSEVGDPVRIIVCLALMGGVCGFLPFNRYPAKIFMGDAGSMMLGFCVAALMVLFAEKIPRWWIASVVIFALPILDTTTALIRRLLNKKPLCISDRGHIYDQMIDRGIPLKKTVAICYALAAMYALIGLIMSQVRTRYALIVYVAVFIVSGVVIWKKGYLRMRGLRGAIRKEQ